MNNQSDPKTPKPFGWEVTVHFQPASGKPDQTFHWRGCTAQRARRKAMMKPNAESIVSTEPIDEPTWIRAYGIGRM